MPTGQGGLPGMMSDDIPPPPGYVAGSGSSTEGQKTHSGTTHNVFNKDPKMVHRDQHFDSKSKPAKKAPWAPPFRLGTSDPGVDVSDARDLINARGSKKAAQANKSYENLKAHPKGRVSDAGDSRTPPRVSDAADSYAPSEESLSHTSTQSISLSDGTVLPAGSAAALAYQGVGANAGAGSDARDSQITGSAAPINHPSDAADSHRAGPRKKNSQTRKLADLGPPTHPHNVNSKAKQAFAFAEEQISTKSDDWYRLCQSFVRQAYGIDPFENQQNDTAYLTWRDFIGGKHPGDRNPPAGVPVYWKGGHPHNGREDGDGHAAISAGNGMIYSNDIGGTKGAISKAPISDIEDKWGFEYLGWGETMNGIRIYDPHGGDDPQGRGIDSSTTSPNRPNAGHTYHAPTASNMPTSGSLPSGVGSGHETYPWGIVPAGKRFSVSARSERAGRGYTKEQLGELWVKAGGDPDLADQAAAVGYYESDSGNPWAKNVNSDSRHSVDKGLFQINDYWQPESSTYDVETNVKNAVKIQKGDGYKWRLWNNPVANELERLAGRPPKKYDPAYVPGKDWNSY